MQEAYQRLLRSYVSDARTGTFLEYRLVHQSFILQVTHTISLIKYKKNYVSDIIVYNILQNQPVS